jgi:hypothetical protein
MPFLIANKVLNSVAGERQHRVAVQITDLFPHKTQSSAVYTPNFQGPQYLYAHGRDVTADVVSAGGNRTVAAETLGLAAYLISTLAHTAGGGGAAIADADAILLANNLIARTLNNQSLTVADFNAEVVAIPGIGVGNGIGEVGTTTTILEVLQVISGYKVYTLPAGSDLIAAAVLNVAISTTASARLTDPADASSLFTKFSDSFYISARKGQLKTAQTAVDTDGNPDPIVVCYADDGSLIQ